MVDGRQQSVPSAVGVRNEAATRTGSFSIVDRLGLANRTRSEGALNDKEAEMVPVAAEPAAAVEPVKEKPIEEAPPLQSQPLPSSTLRRTEKPVEESPKNEKFNRRLSTRIFGLFVPKARGS
jgi:hypothetical protein